MKTIVATVVMSAMALMGADLKTVGNWRIAFDEATGSLSLDNDARQVKLEGKIMRVANMLILLLRDSELDGATYFRCHSRRCTRQEADAMYRGFEENVKDLSRLCSRKKKCNAKQLERMRGVYVQYDKLIGRLASRHHVPSVDHVMAMVRIWAAGRMRRDLATFSK